MKLDMFQGLDRRREELTTLEGDGREIDTSPDLDGVMT